MATNPTPSFSGVIDQNFFIEPLGGPSHPRNYLDRFPEEIYNKSPDSRLVKFMYTLLGPAGIGWFKKNLLDARIAIESQGFELFDLEKFYSSPFQFGRILEEIYDTDPSGLLPRDQWEQIKARDEAYRNRAIEYFNAARLGTSPQGMVLAARSGLGHNADIVENYHFNFDSYSDDRLGIPHSGQTLSNNEFVVFPKPNISQTAVQTISFEYPFDTGSFSVSYNGVSTNLFDPTVTAQQLQSALEALPGIGADNIHVTGDLSSGFDVQFTGQLSNQNVPTLSVSSSLVDTSGVNPTLRTAAVAVQQGGVDPSTEEIYLSPTSLHNLQSALDFLRPVNSLPTVASSKGKVSQQRWSSVFATSEYTEVLRYVSGNTSIPWPPTNTTYWIESGVEKEAPRVTADLQQHYVGFHNVLNISAYTDNALSNIDYNNNKDVVKSYNSQKIGLFSQRQISAVPYLSNFKDFSLIYSADRALADYAEPLTVTTQDENTLTTLINGVYPTDYSLLPGVPALKYKNDHFWASLERPSGSDYLEIDLGKAQAVNFISFDCINVPLRLEVTYDLMDDSPRRHFSEVTPLKQISFPNAVYYDVNQQNPWSHMAFLFTDNVDRIPLTRFIRIKFTRFLDPDPSSRFLFDPITGYQNPFSIEVKNLRVGRNVIV